MKKTAGFYLSALSAVLALVCIFLYGSVLFTSAYVRPLLIADVVVSALVLALVGMNKTVPFGNVLPLVGAVLCMGAVALSIAPMVNTVVFAFMGMNPMSNAQGFLTFAGVGLCAWLLAVIASFMGLFKKAA
ncbi:MAG: hypothetical protein VZQ82_08775 [Lachnospiraceae bacterium]|nr:hypothetical protein [Lachnospiraceae bacterium]